MSNIYKDYRGSRYLKVRKKWEGWYSTSYNANHESEEWIRSRKESLSEFISRQDLGIYNTVVDIGGNRGEYIPEFAKSKFLLDISEREPLFGVSRIRSLDEVRNIDLIIYAHILEHVQNPLTEMKNLFTYAKTVYVEVPFGVPEINHYRRDQFKFFKHFASSFIPSTWRIHSQPSTGRVVSSKKMLTQSEHLTFFSEKSIRALAEKLHSDVKIEKNEVSTPDLRTGIVLQCLFTKTQN